MAGHVGECWLLHVPQTLPLRTHEHTLRRSPGKGNLRSGENPPTNSDGTSARRAQTQKRPNVTANPARAASCGCREQAPPGQARRRPSRTGTRMPGAWRGLRSQARCPPMTDLTWAHADTPSGSWVRQSRRRAGRHQRPPRHHSDSHLSCKVGSRLDRLVWITVSSEQIRAESATTVSARGGCPDS